MKQSILRFGISIILCAISFSVLAQNENTDESFLTEEVEKDTIVPQDKYGLRVGIDIFRPIYSAFDEDKKGFEIVGDFRITKKLFVATELGYSDRYTDEDYINFSTKGSYIKIGVNYNLYKNWVGMNNEIYFGIRYGFSTFTQTLHDYNPNFYGTYFDEINITANTEYGGLTAHWGEFVMGLRVEIFNNFYTGLSLSLKKMVRQKQPENFLNMYIPGFERVYLNNTGFSFNYTVTYLIPIFKKDK